MASLTRLRWNAGMLADEFTAALSMVDASNFAFSNPWPYSARASMRSKKHDYPLPTVGTVMPDDTGAENIDGKPNKVRREWFTNPGDPDGSGSSAQAAAGERNA